MHTAKPFETTGIDFAGPLWIQENGVSKKTYILLLTCATTRAVHLELVPDMTNETFIRALRRFISRRGVPATIYSDNAKTFKKASEELKVINRWNESVEVQTFALSEKIKWKYIVERAAWWGGWWERLVKSVKDALKLTSSKFLLQFDELHTVLTEIENTINSRPLTYIDNDCSNLLSLTPNHFLKPIVQTQLMIQNEERSKLTDIWKKREKLLVKFWKVWKKDYLQQLRSAHHKSLRKTMIFQKGDIVLVHDQVKPRMYWDIAKIIETFPGRDGKVRAVQVKCASGKMLRRPIQLIVPLEIQDTISAPPEDVEFIRAQPATLDRGSRCRAHELDGR